MAERQVSLEVRDKNVKKKRIDTPSTVQSGNQGTRAVESISGGIVRGVIVRTPKSRVFSV